jgi:hypothetical protein
MRDQKLAHTGVEERFGEAWQAFGAGLAVGRGCIAGGQDHEIGVKRQLRDLRGAEQPVIVGTWTGRRWQDKYRLGELWQIAGDQPMRGESNDARGVTRGLARKKVTIYYYRDGRIEVR